MVLVDTWFNIYFAYRIVTFFDSASQLIQLYILFRMVSGSFPFARHYLGNRCFSLFLRVLRWFSSPSSLTYTMNSYTHDDSSVAGFPHSDICGSILICSSPQLFAACHVLLRLPVPRHSPCALISLTFSLLRLFFALPSLLAYAIFNEHIKNVVIMVGLDGLEPSTSRLSGVRSNHLSYKPIMVEMKRFELLTPCLQGRCSPN